MEAKRVVSASSAISNFFESDADKQALLDHISRRRLVSQLVSLRVSKGVTQAQLAKQMGCKQARISKLESGVDADVRASDLEAYAKATESEFTILISDRGKSLAEQIKHEAASIRATFMKLVKLAHQDDLIAQGIAKLHADAFENINRMLSETAQLLPLNPESGMPYLQIISEESTPAGSSSETQNAPVMAAKRRRAKPKQPKLAS